MSFNFGGFGASSQGVPLGGASTGGGFGGFGGGAAKPAAPAFGAQAPATNTGFAAFGGSSASASTGGAAGFGLSSTGGSTGLGFGGSGAAAGAGFGGFGGAAKPAAAAFGAPATSVAAGPATTFGGSTAASFGFGASATGGAAFGAATGGAAFGAAAAPAFGIGGTAGAFTSAKPASTFGTTAATTATAPGNLFGVSPAATTAGGGASADVDILKIAAQHHRKDAMKYLVQPLCGMGNFMGSDVVNAKDIKDGKRKMDTESEQVYQAINEQFIAWAPWDPSVLTLNARMLKEGAFASVMQKAGANGLSKVDELRTLNSMERERELSKYSKHDADLMRRALLPRFDSVTISERKPAEKLQPERAHQPDAIDPESQIDPCEWKPQVDNPHCKFRHYILQPLTQAQMRQEGGKRIDIQSAASSPNDPLFQAKLLSNPNPYKYCVLPVVGFDQLERRVRMQDDKIKEQNDAIAMCQEQVIRMRKLQSVDLPIMLAERRKKQAELGQRTIEVLRRLEAAIEPSSAPSRREEEERRGLNDGLDQLRQDLGSAAQPSLLQRKLQQLEELMAEVRMQDRKRLKQRSVASPACDPAALERLDKFVEHRLKGIRHICDIVEKDYSHSRVMLQHLGYN